MSSTGVVVFNYATWVARYPEFAAVTEPTATLYFNEATIYLNNTDCSPVVDTGKRAVLLNMLTAHIAALAAKAASPGGGIVGRIDSATEGSVSVHAEMVTTPNSTWYMQTPYGAAYWQATAQYRTMKYVPGPVQPIPFGYPYAWRVR